LKAIGFWVLVWTIKSGPPLSNVEREELTVKVVRGRDQELETKVASKNQLSVTCEWAIREEFCSGPFQTRGEASLVKKAKAAELRKLGFGVNGDNTVWKVYVIELDQVRAPDPSCPWVYVGETCKNVEERFLQHKQGKRNRSGRGRLFATVVRKHGVKLRPDLYPPEPNRNYSRKDSEKSEQEWINELKSRGLQVEGGHKSDSPKNSA
jgi:hypothetical protein